MGLKNLIRKVRRSDLVKNTLQIIFSLVGKLPTRKKTIVFESFLGKQYSDNPKALYLYIKSHYPHYRLYWSVDRREVHRFENKGIDLLPRFGLRWIWVMGRAEYWITNSRLPLWIPKPKGTTYVQTWHGTPLKRLAADMEEVHMPGTDTTSYKENFINEAKKWDYLISPNAYSSEIFRRAFQFKGTLIESGYPRNDILLNENNTERISELKRAAGLPLDKKVILYAPTWRDDQFHHVGKYKFQLKMDIDRMREEFGDDYVIILRLHYLIADNINLESYEGFIYDFSQNEDISELYLMSDVLITDYSSVFFDFANLRRPILFYVYDLETYRDKLRGFYFNFEEKAPGPLVKTTEQLIYELKKIEGTSSQEDANIEKFHERFCYLEDGRASERVVRTILKD